MFRKAKIKLTAYYVLIVMLITITLSAVLFVGVVNSASRTFRRGPGRRLESRLVRNPTAPFIEDDLAREIIDDISHQTLVLLIYVNTGIFVITGGLGYLLAGRTLKPIEKMTNKQKLFIADAAHELKTPLAAMKTEIEVALRGKRLSAKEAREVLESNLEEVETLSQLTDTLLKQSKYQSENSLQLSVIDMGELTSMVCKKMENSANTKGLQLLFETENVKARANKDSIRELLTILLDNAIKFTKEGTIKVECKKAKNNVKIQVSDTGVGIREQDLDLIFDRFYKANDSSRNKDKSRGYGLGLSIAKEVVEKHKGAIEVKSKRGKGTTFTVTFPTNL